MQVTAAIEKSYHGKDEKGFVYNIAASFPAFEGHFKGHPLLPAVCQLGLCTHAVGKMTGKKMELSGVKRAKFIRPILPDTSVRVELTPREDMEFAAVLLHTVTGEKFSQITFSVKEF